MRTEYINATPHAVAIIAEGNSARVDPCGTVIRVPQVEKTGPVVGGVQTVSLVPAPGARASVSREVLNLIDDSDPDNQVIVIVSYQVLALLTARARRYAVAPDTSPDSVLRDNYGRILGVRRWQVHSALTK